MTRILVLLLGEHTVANILAALQFRPEIIFFVTTDLMEQERKRDCIENTLSHLALPFQQETVKVDPSDLRDCIAKMETFVKSLGADSEYRVNVTGGTKLMAMAAYEVFRELGGKAVIDYIPLGRNEVLQLFPRGDGLMTTEISHRLDLEAYLSGYGFRIMNRQSLLKSGEAAFQRSGLSRWILEQYEALSEILSVLYDALKMQRNARGSLELDLSLNRPETPAEEELLLKAGLQQNDNRIGGTVGKEEVKFLTGGWLEEYIFHEVRGLKDAGLITDAAMGIQIESLNGAVNELDIAFVRENAFYYLECKTLVGREELEIIRDQVYREGALSKLLGKGEKRAYICTTMKEISPSVLKRAADYGVEILSLAETRGIGSVLKKRFSEK